MIAGFAKRFNSYSDSDFYNAAMDFIKRMRDENIPIGSKEWFSEYDNLEEHKKGMLVNGVKKR